ncbi:hypothetical protein [Nocardia sp. NPDC051832]|uniref:hypothetical protein n=1 Tax=Nocardia sp. NPDC051832 TaxID=3155673 RepID=UPI003427E094
MGDWSRWRRFVPAGYSAGLTLLIAGPLLGPGYLLLRDAVSTPRSYLTDSALGLGDAAPRAVPQDALLAVLSPGIDGGVLVKAILLIALWAAGYGAAVLVRELLRVGLGPQLVATTVALWNPYVAERLLQGHWSLLAGYAALPWTALAAYRLRRTATARRASGTPATGGPPATEGAPAGSRTKAVQRARWRWRAAGSVGAWGALAACFAAAGLTPTGALLAGVTALALLGWRQIPGALLLLVLASAPWLTATVLSGAGAEPSDPAGIAAFAARAEPGLGTLGSLAGLGGIWNADAVPPSRTTILALIGTLALLALVATGLRAVAARPKSARTDTNRPPHPEFVRPDQHGDPLGHPVEPNSALSGSTGIAIQNRAETTDTATTKSGDGTHTGAALAANNVEPANTDAEPTGGARAGLDNRIADPGGEATTARADRATDPGSGTSTGQDDRATDPGRRPTTDHHAADPGRKSATGQDDRVAALGGSAGTEWAGGEGDSSRVRRALLVLAGVAVVVPALAATGVGREVMEWLVVHVPGAGLLRDTQKYVALAMPAYALCAAAGCRALAVRLAGRSGEGAAVRETQVGELSTGIHKASVAGGGTGLVATVFIAMLILPLIDLGWGVGGAVRPVHYPAGWGQVAERIDGPGDVAVLPGGMFRKFSYSGKAPVLDPAPRMLPNDVLQTGVLPVRGAVVSGEGERARQVEELLLHGGSAERLAGFGVGWVLVERTTPGPLGASAKTLGQLEPVYADSQLALYRVPGVQVIESQAAHRFIAGAAHILWAGLLLGGLLIAALARRR